MDGLEENLNMAGLNLTGKTTPNDLERNSKGQRTLERRHGEVEHRWRTNTCLDLLHLEHLCY